MTTLESVDFRPPTVEDGAACWGMAAASGVLDVNSPYAYLLWCRDFADTSIIAESGGDPIGFVTGYRRPADPATLFVWQVAVEVRARGCGIAGRMLDELFRRVQSAPQACTHLECSITADNLASINLFEAFAMRHRGALDTRRLFDAASFPGGADGHDSEMLYRIGPIGAR